MRSLLLYVLFALYTSLAYAEGFHGVHSPNGTDVWAVGNGGLVFHSVDGGATWTSITLGTQTLRAVAALNSNVWITGDNGTCYHSNDAGATWNSVVIGTSSALRAVVFTDPVTGFVAGDNGALFKTEDGGVSWSAKATGTSGNFNDVSFPNASTGYVVGTGGTLVKTTDTGLTWSLLTTGLSATGSNRDFFSVAARGNAVYIAGSDATCLKSTDDGATWERLNFMTDTRSDVNGVFAWDAQHACFIGGGGYIRTTADGGGSYQWGLHSMHAPLSRVFFYDAQKGWACSPKNNAVLRTTNGGQTWSLPQGTTINYNWSQKTSSGSIGNTFMVNPVNKNYIYQVGGNTVYMSADRGDTWVQTATISGASSTWSFYISPKDTNLWIAATSGGGKGVKRSTNRGLTWTTTISRNFTSYGMPLEMDPDHPDTVLFAAEGTGSGPDGVVYISQNFGATWDTLSKTSFRSPCDILIVPDSTNIVYVGDGTTGSGLGQMWRSTNSGRNWTSIYSNASGVSEIPMIAVSRLRKTEGYATGWGGGGFRKTSDFGMSWPSLTTAGSTWGTDIAKDDPNVVLYGLYGGGTSYLSTDAGGTFVSRSLSGSNSGMLCYDRATFLVHQAGNGIWKYLISYSVPTNTASVSVLSPNGGEAWQFGTTQNITWNVSNVGSVKIEYKTSPASPWQTIVANTPGATGSYAWTVPNTPSTQARVKVSNAFGGNPVDSSNNNFAITAASISSQPGSVTFGDVGIGTLATDTVRIYNIGTATLVVSSIALHDAAFGVSRSSFTIPVGGSDTLTVLFSPSQVQLYADTMNITSNAAGTLSIPVAGTGVPASSVGEGELPATYALLQNYPNPFNPVTRISYELPKAGWVTLSVFNMLGQEVATLVNELKSAGRYTAEFNVNGNVALSSGVYMYKLRSGDFTESRKMLLLK